ncbi:MAG: isoprenylcysteine carboxylmethyltransferase family protein [Deltaproteobacteria bacterium]|nr:MAG: isoprenylcysteine carboxylmethyltransferase family protein [Deltaproteobacteria bacterium]
MLLLKNLLFTFVIPGTVAVYVPVRLARWLGRTLCEGALFPLAIVAFALGGGIYLWCLWDFATVGRGTPAPIDAPKRLVVRGLYRYTRNPMYVGVLLVIVGWAAWFATPWLLLYAAGVATLFHLFVVGYEEPHLRRVFGAEYEAYCARVSRWVPLFSRVRKD